MASISRPTSFSDEEDDDGRSSPVLAALDSSSALILVHDDDDDDSPYQFPDEDEDGGEEDSSYNLGIGRPYVQPLSSTLVFLYLLSPFLKLGAILLPNVDLPLKIGLPAIFLFAVLSAFVRQLWYMLARYLRKGDLEDVLTHAFSKSRGSRRTRERIRATVRACVRAGTGTLRMFLATIYLRESAHVLLPLLPEDLPSIPGWVISLVLAVFLYPFIIAQSLSSKRIVYATWSSIVTYLLWFICVTYSHSTGTLAVNPGWLRMGALWQGITTIAFTFTSSSTLTLYTSLKANSHLVTLAQRSHLSRSFKIISILSVAVAVSFTLPLIVFAAFPNEPQVGVPSSRLAPYTAFLSAVTLLLGIPSVLVTTPSLPISERLRRSMTLPLSKTLIFTIVVALSLLPVKVATVFSDILIVGALSATYLLPALVHITTHFFKRPLSIIIPTLPSTPNPFSASASAAASGSGSLPPLPDSGLSVPSSTPPDSANDPLLQRKELALQKKQFRKRIVWDLGVWILLLPVGGGGFVWAAGRIAGRW